MAKTGRNYVGWQSAAVASCAPIAATERPALYEFINSIKSISQHTVGLLSVIRMGGAAPVVTINRPNAAERGAA